VSTPPPDPTFLKGFVLGTAGHVDHGKTSLVRALTGVETDRWKEERERGLTIDIGFAELSLDDTIETGIVDVPGHEDFLKNMLAGATGIDLLVLVVAADEGPMPQTYEHLAIAKLLGIKRGVVALTKTDRVDESWLELATDATAELLDDVLGHDDWPIVPVSTLTGNGMDELRAALCLQLEDVAERPTADLFRLPVDRSFSIRGTGTVVTGTVWSGSVNVGDQLSVLPGRLTARVRALQVHEDARDQVAAGRRCALAMVGLEPPQVPRGSVLVSDTRWTPSYRLGVRLTVLERPGRMLEHGQRVRVYLGTREAMARVVLADSGVLAPGDTDWATLLLEDPLVARVHDRLILRFYSPVTTIGGGEVADLDPPRCWSSRVGDWEVILGSKPSGILAAAVRLRGMMGLLEADAPLATGLAPDTVARVGQDDPSLHRIGDGWFTEEAMDEAITLTLDAVERLHRTHRRSSAVSLGAARARATRTCAPELVEAALALHATRGSLEFDGPRVSLPQHRPDLTAAEEQAHGEVLRVIRESGLQPPTVNDLARTLRIGRDLLDDLLPLLRDEGQIVGITPEIYIAQEERDALVTRIADLLADGEPAPPTRFKEELGLSRKYLIPVLEYLDREGVTRRTGEGRVLAS
jgi:selenocysteine-specific elongation factor